jgi:ribosomal protein S18 acetylase RimI-like enzyme
MRERIEQAIRADAEELSRLINGAYRGESSKAGWTTEADFLDGTRTDTASILDLMDHSGTTLLKYMNDDAIVGCIELRVENQKLYIGMLTVHPNLQGKGVGKKLLARAEKEALSRRCISIYMTVLSVRTELIDWYLRNGYELTGDRKPFDFKDPVFGKPKISLEFVVLEKKL